LKNNLKEGILNFVDLAGSESQKKADTSNRGFEEARKINLGNFNLGHVILALSEKIKPPYRDSKLTHVLQSALGGNGKTLFITNITPSSHLYSETLNSLKYAKKAQKIENIQAKINVQKKEVVVKQIDQEIQELKKTVEDLTKENAMLKSENERLNTTNRNRQNERFDNENDPNDDYLSKDSENEKSEPNSDKKKRPTNLMRQLKLKKSILTQKEEQKEDILNLSRSSKDIDTQSLVKDEGTSLNEFEIEKENFEKSFDDDLTNFDPLQQISGSTNQENNENETIKNYENEILNFKSEKENMEKEIKELKILNKLKEENELFLNEEIKDLKTQKEKILKEYQYKLSTLYDEETKLKNMNRQIFMKFPSDLPESTPKICSIL
jgi:myosin heavy subunit